MSHLHEHIIQLCQQKVTVIDAMHLTQDDIVSAVITSSDKNLIIVDCATPYMLKMSLHSLNEELNKISTHHQWLIVTSDYTYYKSNHPKIVYYPIHLIDGIDKGVESRFALIGNRPYVIGFLSFHLHCSRLLCLIALHQKGLFARTLLNLPTIVDMASSTQLPAYKNALFSLSESEKAEVDELMLLAPIVADPTADQIDLSNVQNRAFSDCYVNLLTESDYPRAFITEKSIKPFLTGQFSAVIAATGVTKHLQELGFDVMSNYINLEFNTTDIRNNINNVVDQITKLIPNIEQVWNDTYIGRVHNYRLIRSPELRAELCRELQERL